MKVFPQGPSLTLRLHINAEGIESSTLLKGSEEKGLCLQIYNENKNPLLSHQILDWVQNYVERRPSSLVLPLNIDSLPPFTSKVLQYLAAIPFGSTISYGELAQKAGSPKAYRAVGNACNRNPFPLFTPCHRVIASGKKIGGFAMDLNIKKALLSFENSELQLSE